MRNQCGLWTSRCLGATVHPVSGIFCYRLYVLPVPLQNVNIPALSLSVYT
jgi:hypothetical protein